jgi:hypothetical protein
MEGDGNEDAVGDMKDGEVECEGLAEELAQFAGDVFRFIGIFQSVNGFFYDGVS